MRILKLIFFTFLVIFLVGIFSIIFFNAFQLHSHLPKNFFNEKTKNELTVIADKLLKSPNLESSKEITTILDKYALKLFNIDVYENVVEFGYPHRRTWYVYIYARNGLKKIYSVPPVITEQDIRNWGELVDIVKRGNDYSESGRHSIVFVPEIVYPFLEGNLNQRLLNKLKEFPSRDEDYKDLETLDKSYSNHNRLVGDKLNPEEKLCVIETLNKHRLLSSRLVENPNIQYVQETDTKRTIEFGSFTKLGSVFQVEIHLQKLIEKGIIKIIDKEGHLRIKSDLTDEEIREVEWLNVEIMNFIYGNLIDKKQYFSDSKERLTNRWYFYKR